MKKFTTKVLAIVMVMVLNFSFVVFAQEGNWGLGGYGTSGEKPTGNTSQEELAKHNAYFVGSSDEKVIYLTFDSGFENGNTEPILDVLRETKVPATFFLVGTYLRDYPELVKQMVEDGHIVGNHTMHHPNMSAISSLESFQKELTEAENYYFEATGKKMPKYYRPPQGKYSTDNLKMANELGYKTVFWSLAYVDWNVDKQPTKEQAFEKLIPRVHPGAVLLLHSTSKTNATILKELIEKYKELGYEFKNIDELK